MSTGSSLSRMKIDHAMRLWPLLGLVFAVGLGGCGGGDEDLHEFVAKSGEGLRGQVEPLEPPKSYEPFVYDAFDFSDPFKPRKLKKEKGGGLQPDFDRPREILEGFGLENLSMVGSIHDKDGWYALIRAPDNALYRVGVGNYLGQNFGRVLSIDETEIKLIEMIEDSSGDWVEQPNTLLLQEEAQGQSGK